MRIIDDELLFSCQTVSLNIAMAVWAEQTVKIVLSAKAEKASSSSIKRRATEEKGIPPLFRFSTFPHRMSRRSILSYCRLEIKTQSQVKFIKY